MVSEPSWGKKSVLIGAIIIYLITFLISPAKAKESIIFSLNELKKLLLPILVAIFIGTTVKTLITPSIISKIFDGRKGLLTAGVMGSVLPPCPYISYPTINGFREGGTSIPLTMVMLTTTTTVEVGQLFCGIVVFGPKIVGLRIFFAFVASMMIGMIFLAFYSKVSFFSSFLPSSGLEKR